MGFILNTDVKKNKTKNPHIVLTLWTRGFFFLHDGEMQWYTFSAVKKSLERRERMLKGKQDRLHYAAV